MDFPLSFHLGLFEVKRELVFGILLSILKEIIKCPWR